jgi:hypothetical protein
MLSLLHPDTRNSVFVDAAHSNCLVNRPYFFCAPAGTISRVDGELQMTNETERRPPYDWEPVHDLWERKGFEEAEDCRKAKRRPGYTRTAC